MGSALEPLGRFGRPAQQVLDVLSAGPRVPSKIVRELDARCGVELGPGTLSRTIARLERHGLIGVVAARTAPRAYRLTALGAETLDAQLEAVRLGSPSSTPDTTGSRAR